MHKSFDTPGPISLYVELRAGHLTVIAADTGTTRVDVEGEEAEDVAVEQRGDQITVVAPQRTGIFGGSAELDVTVTVPTGSQLSTKTGSADVDARGRITTAKIKSGSGDIALELVADATVETGSGDTGIGSVTGALRIKSGSGDVEVGAVSGAATIATGSGDVELGTTQGPVQVKSGSGDLSVRRACTDVALRTASGDVYVGVIERGSALANNVSGDVRIGIPAGIPVWTDVSAVTGTVSSSLQGAGQPAAGQEFIEVRAKTVSGDIHLEQLGSPSERLTDV